MVISKYLKKILVLVFIFSFLNTYTSYASIKESIKFNSITIEDGLSQSTVETMYQDSKGYIWIGTSDGLNKYNGYKFKYYKNDKYNKNSLASNYIIDIAEDKDGYIWVATLEGASKINPNTDEIENFFADENNGNLSNKRVCKIINTKDNKIFMATNDGLNIYDEKSNKFFRVLDKESDLPSQYIYTIEEDSRGHIWVGTDAGLVEFDKDLNKVNSYESTIGELDVYSIYDDLKGHMWIGTLRHGLFKINLDDGSVDNYTNTESENSIPNNTIRAIVMDSKEKLWLATDKGICSFDYKKEIFTSYKKEPYDEKSLINDKTRSLLIDDSGIIFVGTYSGISVFNPNSNFYYFKSRPYDINGLSGDVINGLYKDNDKTLWVGTNENGVNIINGENVKHLNTQNSEIISDSIHDITGFDNSVFIGTNEGLSVVEKNINNSYTITNYVEEDGLPSNKVRSLFVDSKGYLWIGTNKGISVLDIKNKKITNITYILDEMGVSDKFIRAIHEDSNGIYYIGCFLEGGLIKINPNTKEYKVYKNDENDTESISNNSVRYITEDLKGNILIGTSFGINILKPDTDKFQHYTEEDGLVDNTIYGILVDKGNNLWMSTNRGISRLSLEQETIKNFTVADGLQSNEFNGRSCFGDDEGYLYFGGINGFNIVDTNNIELSQFQPKITLENFEINGINREDISNTNLKYNENNIRIKFFSNDYRNTRNNKYFYRLKGVDYSWNLTENNSITFANLPPEDYVLEVKTVTPHGVESEISCINFTINPPIWKNKYALCLYWVLIILAIYLYRNKMKTLDRLVGIKTSELRKEMEKNEQLFNQVLILEQNKNNYFVNLSHELRTPLNILSSINQLIKSCLKDDMVLTTEKLMHYMDIMNRNCNRLLNLINNLIDYTRIENNSYTLDKKIVDIVYLTEETVLDMKDYVEEKGIELIFDTDVEEKVIECDKLDIERCIINLVNNAAKFTPEGGLIEVVVCDLDDKVKISVKDNGIGISEENQKMIFDRFNQVIDEASEQKGGSGLGLTITKQIINLHCGEIYVNSKLNDGSEFVIILPVK